MVTFTAIGGDDRRGSVTRRLLRKRFAATDCEHENSVDSPFFATSAAAAFWFMCFGFNFPLSTTRAWRHGATAASPGRRHWNETLTAEQVTTICMTDNNEYDRARSLC